MLKKISYSPGFPGLENLDKEIMELLGPSFYSEIKYKLIELNSQDVDND